MRAASAGAFGRIDLQRLAVGWGPIARVRGRACSARVAMDAMEQPRETLHREFDIRMCSLARVLPEAPTGRMAVAIVLAGQQTTFRALRTKQLHYERKVQVTGNQLKGKLARALFGRKLSCKLIPHAVFDELCDELQQSTVC